MKVLAPKKNHINEPLYQWDDKGKRIPKGMEFHALAQPLYRCHFDEKIELLNQRPRL